MVVCEACRYRSSNRRFIELRDRTQRSRCAPWKTRGSLDDHEFRIVRSRGGQNASAKNHCPWREKRSAVAENVSEGSSLCLVTMAASSCTEQDHGQNAQAAKGKGWSLRLRLNV